MQRRVANGEDTHTRSSVLAKCHQQRHIAITSNAIFRCKAQFLTNLLQKLVQNPLSTSTILFPTSFISSETTRDRTALVVILIVPIELD